MSFSWSLGIQGWEEGGGLQLPQLQKLYDFLDKTLMNQTTALEEKTYKFMLSVRFPKPITEVSTY